MSSKMFEMSFSITCHLKCDGKDTGENIHDCKKCQNYPVNVSINTIEQ